MITSPPKASFNTPLVSLILMVTVSIITVSVTLVTASITAPAAYAQANEENFRMRSVRVSIGAYQPSFGYFDRTAWNFAGGSVGDVSAEWNLIGPVSMVAGVGYFSTSSNIKRGDLAYDEQLVYDMLPISFGFKGRFTVSDLTFPGTDAWNIYVAPSADLLFITASYRYCVCAPESVRKGSTLAYSVNGGAEVAIGSVGLDVYMGYRTGEFEQSLQFNEDSSPTTEGISLNGLMYGVRLAFLF